MNLLEKALALPVARQLDRLNGNLEAIMKHFGIPTPAESAAAANDPVEVSFFDEEAAAIEEFEAENRPQRPPADRMDD